MDKRKLSAVSRMPQHGITHLTSFQRLLGGCFCLFLMLALATISNGNQNGKLVISSLEETTKDMQSVPCKDKDRLDATKALFVKLGAPADQVSVEKHDGVENLVIRKIGKSQGTIVIGAHYDKVTGGCGALDNWSGIVALAHIFRSLKDVPLEKSLIFVAFGKEEKGLLGSKGMVRGIKKEELEQYCAMVNIDSLGMAAPQVPVNLSSGPLVKRVEDLAQRMKVPFNTVTIAGSSDSYSYIARKIPAITISAVGDGWETVLHTDKDQLTIVNQTSVYVGYRLALALVVELTELGCGVSRQDAIKK